MTTGFYYRTEDIRSDKVLDLFVGSQLDREIVNLFKSPVPTVLEGSRGTGKSFLMAVARIELENSFNELKILPVYVAFRGSSLVHTSDPLQFRHWMLTKVIREVLKELCKKGLIVSSYACSLLSDNTNQDQTRLETKLEQIVDNYEKSYQNPGNTVNIINIPDISDVRDAFEDICITLGLERISLFFDEAAHVFRPEQQRQFFTLFRDFRSPYISCNAAVYPGVTHYGSFFEITHDATFKRIERDILEAGYLDFMWEIFQKQADEPVKIAFEKQRSLFNTLALSASGNPRILFKTLSKSNKVNTSEVESVVRNYYRADIWSEHTKLGEKYIGHKALIDWGRNFIETHILTAIHNKNQWQIKEGKEELTVYFWIHKDVPEMVKEALRLLCYTGIIRKIDDGVRNSHSKIGSRYEIKYGCILSLAPNPQSYSEVLGRNLDIRRFNEFGATHLAYQSLPQQNLQEVQDEEIAIIVRMQLQQSIDVLDITDWQKEKLKGVGVTTIESLLSLDEEYLINNIHHVGSVRARTMKNAATAELLEYLSG
ncbi:MAG: hypothetical protein V7L29_25705 [Nostoc sp.]|uniref:ORC-CDC6 family AAA ATPase n=1 Tax=Nostoc sp. TaxID=1180 RepID=UPI002FFCEA0C